MPIKWVVFTKKIFGSYVEHFWVHSHWGTNIFINKYFIFLLFHTSFLIIFKNIYYKIYYIYTHVSSRKLLKIYQRYLHKKNFIRTRTYLVLRLLFPSSVFCSLFSPLKICYTSYTKPNNILSYFSALPIPLTFQFCSLL